MSISSPPPAATDRLAAPALAPALQIIGACKRFGANLVLNQVSLELYPGEIRALCGENGAGKSTLVKIVTGIHPADEGRILVDGVPCAIASPQEAQARGIALVSQELSLAPNLSVLDNIWLGSGEVPLFHRRASLRTRAVEALAQVGLGGLDPALPVGRLGIGQRQLVEIARMLTRHARVLILDEPTATLSDVEIDHVFHALRLLRAQGRAVLYITHRLAEVFDICDSVTVLRNGELIGTARTAAIDRLQLMAMMLGRELGQLYPQEDVQAGFAGLAVRGLRLPGALHGLDLQAPAGAVTCLAGQVGSGATEALRALAGLAPAATGRASAMGRGYRLRAVSRARAARVFFVSEDRAHEGIFLRLSVADNLVATQLRGFSRVGVLMLGALRRQARRLAAAVGVDARRLGSPAGELSGGNQQKLAFGRLLVDGPPGVLLLNEPTRGVDVGARADIYRLVRRFCAEGWAVVMASSDLEEVLGMSDAIVTLYRGRLVARYARGQAGMHRILADITHPAPT